MAIQREDPYCILNGPHCVVTGCLRPVVVEVMNAYYPLALAMFYGIHRKARGRRNRDPRIFCCEEHFKHDPRMSRLHWQDVFSFVGGIE
jgi:hypothetical protein